MESTGQESLRPLFRVGTAGGASRGSCDCVGVNNSAGVQRLLQLTQTFRNSEIGAVACSVDGGRTWKSAGTAWYVLGVQA